MNGLKREKPIGSTADPQPKSGHFRVFFNGFRIKSADATAASANESAWSAPEAEDEKAYFQADISWINLAGGDSPQSSVLTAMITGDVRGLKKRTPWEDTGMRSAPGWLPLSLGSYALVAKTNAISIGNFSIERGARRFPAGTPEPGPVMTDTAPVREISDRKWQGPGGRTCVVDLPLRKATRTKVIFLTYESANTLSKTDQGFGRGVFPIDYMDRSDPGLEYTLYFAIDRL